MIPPFADGDAKWNEVITCFRDLYSPFNVEVTDLDPGATPHVESAVGGALGGPQIGGVAPFSCGLIPRAIVFTFSDVYGGDVRGICETAGQETAHAFGLDHQYLCADPMTYLGGCGDKSFQDVDAPCGTDAPETCTCGGATQNSYQRLLALFGPAYPPCTTNDDCADLGVCLGDECVDGPGEPGGLGESCMIDGDCRSGTCAQSSDGNRCAEFCTPGVAGFCPSGFDCVEISPGDGLCWAGDGGCCAIAGSRRTSPFPWLMLGLFGWVAVAVNRRRKT